MLDHMKTYMRPLSKTVPRLAKKALGKKYDRPIGRISMEWPQIAGDYLSERAFPMDLKMRKTPSGMQATLVLAVNSAFAPEIQYAIPQLLERVNTFIGRKLVTDIRLVDADFNAGDSKTRLRKSKPRPERPLPPEKQQVISSGIDSIDDPQLREALSSFGTAMMRED